MKIILWGVGILLVIAVIGSAGGGGGSSDDDSKAPDKPERVSYNAQVKECLTGVSWELSKSGTDTRVSSPAGNLIADIHFFKTAKEAERFDRRLLIDDHAVGGRAVAMFLQDADDGDRRVVVDCLTPENLEP